MHTLYYYCAPEVTAARRAEFAQLIAAAQTSAHDAAQASASEAGGWQLVAVSDYDALIKATTLRAKGKTVTGLALEPEDVLLELTPPMAGVGLRLGSLANFKPLVIDFEQVAVRQRLLRGGRQKEAVARAVMAGLPDGALVFDATAGLGRESMILAHAGANVLSFERQLPIWCILHDGLLRAGRSRFYPFPVPTLHPLGTIKDYRGTERPEVIYYDPMFPERSGSAQVKKDMHIPGAWWSNVLIMPRRFLTQRLSCPTASMAANAVLTATKWTKALRGRGAQSRSGSKWLEPWHRV